MYRCNALYYIIATHVEAKHFFMFNSMSEGTEASEKTSSVNAEY